MQLNTDDLIKLAENGKVRNIELDDTARIVLYKCLYMLNFEKRYYEKGGKKECGEK